MVSRDRALVYSEVYSVLSSMSEWYIKAIPAKLYSFVENNRFKEYNPVYDLNIPLTKQKISKGAVSFICMLHYNCWCKSDEEKRSIEKILKHNEQMNRNKYFKYEEELFNKNKTDKNDSNEVEGKSQLEKNVSLTIQKQDGLIERIINFFKGIFKK
ncbi:MAG: hypothetical protein IKG42_00560 [Clostridia bacterium]|nr:hypothetical protein [Clostridia bacterium]